MGGTEAGEGSPDEGGSNGKIAVLAMVGLAVALTGLAMFFKQHGGLRYAEKQLDERGVSTETELVRAAARAASEHAVRSRLAKAFDPARAWSFADVIGEPGAEHELAAAPAAWVIASTATGTKTADRWTPWREDHVPAKGAPADLTVPSVEVLTAIALLDELRAKGVSWHLAISAFGILQSGDGDPRLDVKPLTIRFKEKQAWKLFIERPDGPPFVYAALPASERAARMAFLDEVRDLVAGEAVSTLKWANYLPTLERQLGSLQAEGQARKIPYRLQVSTKFPWTIAVASPGDGDFRWIQAPRSKP